MYGASQGEEEFRDAGSVQALARVYCIVVTRRLIA